MIIQANLAISSDFGVCEPLTAIDLDICSLGLDSTQLGWPTSAAESFYPIDCESFLFPIFGKFQCLSIRKGSCNELCNLLLTCCRLGENNKGLRTGLKWRVPFNHIHVLACYRLVLDLLKFRSNLESFVVRFFLDDNMDILSISQSL